MVRQTLKSILEQTKHFVMLTSEAIEYRFSIKWLSNGAKRKEDFYCDHKRAG
jgi:hypothetical protein